MSFLVLSAHIFLSFLFSYLEISFASTSSRDLFSPYHNKTDDKIDEEVLLPYVLTKHEFTQVQIDEIEGILYMPSGHSIEETVGISISSHSLFITVN